MPIPLIIPVVIGVASAPGIKAAIEGRKKVARAKASVQGQEKVLKNARRLLDIKQGDLKRTLETVGRTKLIALETGLIPFHETYSEFRNVQLEELPQEGDLTLVENQEVLDAGALDVSARDLVVGSGKAGSSGAGVFLAATKGAGAATATAAATWVAGATGAAASTGTAIGGLSGAAATNATLAWLGGGSVAAGGGGVAAGTVVLGSTVAAPVVATVGGFLLYQKGKQAEAKADAFAGRVKSERARLMIGLYGLEAAAFVFQSIEMQIQLLLPRLTELTESIRQIAKRETDWANLNTEEKAALRRCALFATAVSRLAHTQVLGDSGLITRAIQNAMDRGAATLATEH